MTTSDSWADELRRRLERGEAMVLPMENARVIPPERITLVRTIDAYATTPPGPTSFDRVFSVLEQYDEGAAAAKLQKDLDNEEVSIPQTDRDGCLQKYSFDVALMEFGQHRIIVPSPHRMIFVLDDSAGGPFPGARLGTIADISKTGVVTGFRTARPILFAQTVGQFVVGAGLPGTSFPTKTGNVYPGIQAWPLPSDPIAGVDDVVGFFICALQAPGVAIADLVKTVVIPAIPAGGGAVAAKTITQTYKRDAQGNLLDVTLSIA